MGTMARLDMEDLEGLVAEKADYGICLINQFG